MQGSGGDNQAAMDFDSTTANGQDVQRQKKLTKEFLNEKGCTMPLKL
jgi:hypothetical protein